MKDLVKKWWFWLIILAIVIVLSLTTIILMGYGLIKGETGDLAIEIQGIYEDATVYSSAGGNTLVVELRNWDNQHSEELSKIINTVKTRLNNNQLSSYNKLVTLTYLESNNKEEVLFMKTTYNIPDFVKDEANTKTYIAYEEYENLFGTLNNTMNGYTSLFNSIY